MFDKVSNLAVMTVARRFPIPTYALCPKEHRPAGIVERYAQSSAHIIYVIGAVENMTSQSSSSRWIRTSTPPRRSGAMAQKSRMRLKDVIRYSLFAFPYHFTMEFVTVPSVHWMLIGWS